METALSMTVNELMANGYWNDFCEEVSGTSDEHLITASTDTVVPIPPFLEEQILWDQAGD